MVTCIIGLGANLANPQQQLKDACHTLATNAVITNFQASSLYSSTPLGPVEQPDYVNAVARFNTLLTPHALLDLLQAIEQQQGRVRLEHWGPRTLDLDLLFYGQQQIQDERLTVPHSGILEREFVVIPLAELCPDYILPNQIAAADYAKGLPLKGLRRISQAYP